MISAIFCSSLSSFLCLSSFRFCSTSCFLSFSSCSSYSLSTASISSTCVSNSFFLISGFFGSPLVSLLTLTLILVCFWFFSAGEFVLRLFCVCSGFLFFLQQARQNPPGDGTCDRSRSSSQVCLRQVERTPPAAKRHRALRPREVLTTTPTASYPPLKPEKTSHKYEGLSYRHVLGPCRDAITGRQNRQLVLV